MGMETRPFYQPTQLFFCTRLNANQGPKSEVAPAFRELLVETGFSRNDPLQRTGDLRPAIGFRGHVAGSAINVGSEGESHADTPISLCGAPRWEISCPAPLTTHSAWVIVSGMDQNKTLTEAEQSIVDKAVAAQARLAEIARTRRPTKSETATARRAYAAAAKVTG